MYVGVAWEGCDELWWLFKGEVRDAVRLCVPYIRSTLHTSLKCCCITWLWELQT